MADLVSPDQIRSRSFRTTFRGYDQAEVAEFLDRLARTVASLEADRLHLRGRAEELGDGDLRTEFQRVAAEVGEVLEAARVAAEGMRERAAVESEEWTKSASEAARTERRGAQADAEALRGDAWSTAKALLDQSQAEAKRIREVADRDALAIVGHSERESHRTQAAARREAEEQVRTAKMESERLLVDARAQHDEIIDSARKEAEAAQERARALEVRRDELLAELETVRSKIRVMETDIEERREPVPNAAQGQSVRLIPQEGTDEDKPAPAAWSAADSVRIIPAADTRIDPDAPVDAASLADEVRRLRDEADIAESVAEPDGPEEETPAEPEPESVESEAPVAEPAEEPAEAEPVVEVDDQTAEMEPDEEPWALDSLFATLRNGSEEEEPSAAPEYPPEPTAEAATVEAPSEAVPIVEEMPGDGDVIADRDRLLLPITNRVLRSIKRQLTEAQNLTLEDVRVKEGWDSDSVDLVDGFRGDLVVLVQESFAAGQSAAASVLAVDVGRPKPQKDDVPDHSEEFASALLQALVHVAETASEQGPRALSASLSRVYRAWRADEAERRIRDYATRAFHRGMLAGGRGAGAERISWVVAGRGCPTCRAAAKAGAVAIESDFPGIEGVPPAHPGCACTIVPA
jgi:DivIVA domain-containing protein